MRFIATIKYHANNQLSRSFIIKPSPINSKKVFLSRGNSMRKNRRDESPVKIEIKVEANESPTGEEGTVV